ncbi:hypothetical protein DY000_02056476 [Brassica cretica]|uniref:Uncharacterized protein n=1 Tax=Brassica cretica TaxID=69181 RepID=A0ABQ7AGV5_BRACR|nr:hypothetical protein DY000_02056476 [Brassica cretica]
MSKAKTKFNLPPVSGGASEHVPTPVALLLPCLCSLCLCIAFFPSSGYACGSGLGFRSVDSSAREGSVMQLSCRSSGGSPAAVIGVSGSLRVVENRPQLFLRSCLDCNCSGSADTGVGFYQSGFRGWRVRSIDDISCFLLGSAESCALLGCVWTLVTEALRYVYRPLLLVRASWTAKATIGTILNGFGEDCFSSFWNGSEPMWIELWRRIGGSNDAGSCDLASEDNTDLQLQ